VWSIRTGTRLDAGCRQVELEIDTVGIQRVRWDVAVHCACGERDHAFLAGEILVQIMDAGCGYRTETEPV
jgi:hypothetical protein